MRVTFSPTARTSSFRDIARLAFSYRELWPIALVLLVAGCIRMVFWSINLPPFLNPDSVQYFRPGFDFLSSGELNLGLLRTPGYPLFLAGTLAIFGKGSLIPILAVQHVVGLGTAGLTYVLGRLLFGRGLALVAGLLVGLDGGPLLFEHFIMTEALFTFWLVLCCLLLVLGLRLQSPGWLLGAGLALGVLALIRPTGQFLLLPALVAGLLAIRPVSWPRTLLLGVGFVLIVTPWMVRNWINYETPSLAGSGRFLVERGLKYEDLFVRWTDSSTGTPSDPLRAAALAIILEEDRKPQHGSVASRFARELGLGEGESDALMREFSLAAISAQPLHYLATSSWYAYLIAVNRPVDVLYEWRGYDEVSWPRRLSYLLPYQAQDALPTAQVLVGLVDPGRFGHTLLLLFGVGVLFSWREPGSRLWLLPASMVLIGILSNAAFGGVERRYRYVFDPLLLLGATFGTGALLQLGQRWRRRASVRWGSLNLRWPRYIRRTTA